MFTLINGSDGQLQTSAVLLLPELLHTNVLLTAEGDEVPALVLVWSAALDEKSL